jgi:glycosyltransferase involved in cell wall biosynthesis
VSALPGVSVVIPTLNAEKYLAECLAALRDQDYPAELVEILLIDAGSTDRTLEIAQAHGVDRVLANPLRTGEAGKAVGLRAARHDLLCMVDSDNVVVGDDWLRRMVAPFEDEEVVSSEALRWDYRREDHFINRYQALTGINDPLALFVGNYDRWSELTGRWTDYPHRSEQRDSWERVELDPRYVPTMGANGYIVRRRALEVVPVDDYLFDIDFVYDLVQRGERIVARVDVPVRHYFCDSVRRFYLKTRRRTDDYHYFARAGRRSYPWTQRQRLGVVRFVLSTVLVVPLLVQVGRGWRRKPDPAWLFHLPACWITLGVYAAGYVRGRFAPEMLNRDTWSQ